MPSMATKRSMLESEAVNSLGLGDALQDLQFDDEQRRRLQAQKLSRLGTPAVMSLGLGGLAGTGRGLNGY